MILDYFYIHWSWSGWDFGSTSADDLMVTWASVIHGKPTCGFVLAVPLNLRVTLSKSLPAALSVKWGHWTRSASRSDLVVGDVEGGVETVAVFPDKVPMRLLPGGLVGGLPDLVSETTGQPVIFEFQIYNQYSVVWVCPMQYLGHNYTQSICHIYEIQIYLRNLYFIWHPYLEGFLFSLYPFRKKRKNKQVNEQAKFVNFCFYYVCKNLPFWVFNLWHHSTQNIKCRREKQYYFIFLLIEHLFAFKKHNSMSVCDISSYLVT